MGWYNETFNRRTPITVINTAGSATVDVDIAVPSQFDEFWNSFTASGDVDGFSIRVTDSDGVTLLNYAFDDGAGGAVDPSTRTGRIRLDGVAMTATANTIVCLWLYYDTGATAAADGSTAVTISGALTGYIDLGKPTSKNYPVRPLAIGVTRPSVEFAKSASDSDDVWISWAAWLELGKTDLLGHRNYEEPKHAVITAQDTGGGAVTTVYTVSLARWAEVDGQLWFRCPVTAGSTGSNYTIAVKATTIVPNDSANHRIYQERFGLRVKDVLETA